MVPATEHNKTNLSLSEHSLQRNLRDATSSDPSDSTLYTRNTSIHVNAINSVHGVLVAPPTATRRCTEKKEPETRHRQAASKRRELHVNPVRRLTRREVLTRKRSSSTFSLRGPHGSWVALAPFRALCSLFCPP